MGPYQRTPKEVAKAIRYSGLGVRSVDPVGDFLEPTIFTRWEVDLFNFRAVFLRLEVTYFPGFLTRNFPLLLHRQENILKRDRNTKRKETSLPTPTFQGLLWV